MVKSTAQIPIQTLNAEFAAAEANRDERTVPVTFYTGAQVLQFNWVDGLYKLTLLMEPGNVKLGTLNSGRAPFTLGHADANDPLATIGTISNARIENGKAKADVRFSQRPEVVPIFADVLDGILPNVSVGARVHKLKETTQDGDTVRSFEASSWEPFAIALVGLGADPGAHFSAVELSAECEVELRATAQEGVEMEEQTQSNMEQVALAAAVAERTRNRDINQVARVLHLEASFATQHIEAGTSIEEFQRLAFARAATEADSVQTRGHHVTMLRDEADTRRELMSAAVLNRVDPSRFAVDGQNGFRGRELYRMAEDALEQQGVRCAGRSRHDIVLMSMQNTADFPYVLENSARKMLLATYQAAPVTYRTWAKPAVTPDFKTMSRVRRSESPAFLKVPEGGQITIHQMSESRETYALATYGVGVSFTRQMLISDDLGAFSDLIGPFGRQAARMENKTVYQVLIANAAMSDTVALFHATHANLGSGAIGNTGLDAMFIAMAAQKDLDGVSTLGIVPKYLIVPSTLATTALKNLTEIGPNVKTGDTNWFAGRLTAVADPELPATVWYGAADPADAPLVEFCHLEGAEGPQFIRAENQNGVLGIQFMAFIDFAAKAVDWRSGYKSTGV